jgi:hypothetical protein
MKNEFSIEAELIRRQVQVALAANRTPGYHDPGYLLGCHWPRIGEEGLDAVMPDGPQGRNVDSTTNLAGHGGPPCTCMPSSLQSGFTMGAASPRCGRRSGTRTGRGCWR